VAKQVLSSVDIFRLGITNSRLMKSLGRSSAMPNCFEMKVIQHGSSRTILHCGAHLGEESALYRRCGAIEIFWVEAQPSKVSILRELFGSKNVFSGVLAQESGRKVPFFITSNSLSSSSRQINPNPWDVAVEEVVQLETVKLDDIARDIYLRIRKLPDLLVLDLQGAEYEAILGAEFLISEINFLIVEFSNYQLYKDQKTLLDILSIPSLQSFTLVYKLEESGHGEALFVRTSELKFSKRVKSLIILNYFLLKAKFSMLLRRILIKTSLVIQQLNKNSS
jgi:FkbM family methyltransferase